VDPGRGGRGAGRTLTSWPPSAPGSSKSSPGNLAAASSDAGGISLMARTAHFPSRHSRVLKHPLSWGMLPGSPRSGQRAPSTCRLTAS
jgi:hypothetical protein